MPTTAIPDEGSTEGAELPDGTISRNSRTSMPAITMEHTAQMAAIAIGVLYAAGFVIVNSYLKDFEVLKFEILRSRYIAAGLVFILACGPPSILLCHFMMIGRRHAASFLEDEDRMERLAFYSRYAAFGLLLSLLVWTGVMTAVTIDYIGSASFFTTWIGITLMGSVPWVVRWSNVHYGSDDMSNVERAYDRSMLFMCSVLSIFFIAMLFADRVFAHVKPEFGGGMGWHVRTLASNDSMPPYVRSLLGKPSSVIVDRDERSIILLTCNLDLTEKRSATIIEVSQSSVSAFMIFGPVTHDDFMDFCVSARSKLRARAAAQPPRNGASPPAPADSRAPADSGGATRGGNAAAPDSVRRRE